MTDFPAKSETRDGYRYFCKITTRWADQDVYRHVNNAIYNNWVDSAVAQYLVEQGVLDPDTSPVIGFIVESFCQFRAPVGFPGVIEAGVRVAHIGNSSVRYEVALFRENVEQAVAVSYFVHVFVERATNNPSRVPKDTRRALEAISVDHPLED